MTQQPNPQDQYSGIGLDDVRRVLDSKLVNTGVPSAIAGFGISRAFEGEWWKFLSLIGAAVAVWLLLRIGNRLAPRVDNAIEQADKAISTRYELARTNRGKFKQQYLEALRTRCVDLNVEGYGGLPRLALEDIYVSLRMHPGGRGNPVLQNRNLNIWDILPKADDPAQTFLVRLVVVIADPGYGKTTLMQFLTLSFSNQGYVEEGAKELIPVLLLFRDFHGHIQAENVPTLPELIVETVQKLPRCEDLRASEPWFRKKLQQGKCLVMLDGLDEVPDGQREAVSKWANWQMQNYPSQFILTSRPHGYNSSLFKGVERIDVLDFNDDQKRTFIEKWYRFIAWETKWRWHWIESQRQEPAKQLSEEQARAQSQEDADKAAADLKQQLFADRSLIDLAKNPLLLTIIAVAHKFKERLPQRRLDVYREIFKLMLEDRPYQRQTRLTISSATDNQRILQPLAQALIKANSTKFKPSQGAEWIKNRLTETYSDPALTPEDFLAEIQQVSGLLAGGEGYLYEFSHKTFQEYLAAVEKSERRLGNREVMEHFSDESWKEVVYFYSLLTDPVPFIETALETPENLYTLELAQQIVNDAESIDQGLKQKLLDVLQEQEPKSATVLLEQRFQKLIRLSEQTAISTPVTWGEYSMLISKQIAEEFYSSANDEMFVGPNFYSPDSDAPIDAGIAWQDAQWFCAWLATQAHLAPDDEVYDYRLPTAEELSQIALGPEEQPWTNDPKQPGNSLRIVRQRIPNRYRELVNYLASGSWKEADEETDKLMLITVGRSAEERGFLEMEDIQEFPCEDLQIIDQLWMKFSGGKFGFSAQSKIWIDVGGKLDFGKDRRAATSAFNEMSNYNGWRQNRKYVPCPTGVIFDITAPDGHLPSWGLELELYIGGSLDRGWWGGFASSCFASKLVKPSK